MIIMKNTILLTKTTAAQNGVALSYHSVRGIYFLAVVFAVTIKAKQCFTVPRGCFFYFEVCLYELNYLCKYICVLNCDEVIKRNRQNLLKDENLQSRLCFTPHSAGKVLKQLY